MHMNNNSYFTQEIINHHANDPILPNSTLFGDRTCKKQICRACLMIGGVFLLAMSFSVAFISLTFCPIDGDSISASVSLAEADYYNNTTVFAFNVHIELAASKWDTRYGNTTVFLRHPNGTEIDGFPVAGARLEYKETRRVDAPLRMVISRRHSLFNGSDPVVSGGGVVWLEMHVRFPEKVWIFKPRPVAEVNCDLVVDVEGRALAYNECETKLSCKAKQRS